MSDPPVSFEPASAIELFELLKEESIKSVYNRFFS